MAFTGTAAFQLGEAQDLAGHLAARLVDTHEAQVRRGKGRAIDLQLVEFSEEPSFARNGRIGPAKEDRTITGRQRHGQRTDLAPVEVEGHFAAVRGDRDLAPSRGGQSFRGHRAGLAVDFEEWCAAGGEAQAEISGARAGEKNGLVRRGDRLDPENEREATVRTPRISR